MADVIGLVASIYGIIQLSGKLTQVFGGYIGGVKRAPEDIKTLRDELDSLTSVLNLLEKCAKENPLSTALQDLCGQDKALSRCKDELEKLQNNLVPPKSGLRGVIDRLKWPLKEKETSQYISQIRGYTSAFNLVVSTVQVYVTCYSMDL
jgi:hypothetical protein